MELDFIEEYFTDEDDYLVTMSLDFDEFEEVLQELTRQHNHEYLYQLLAYSSKRCANRRRKSVLSRVLFTAVEVNDVSIVSKLLRYGGFTLFLSLLKLNASIYMVTQTNINLTSCHITRLTIKATLNFDNPSVI